MTLNDLWEFIAEAVFILPSTEVLFNQYNDSNPVFDKESADLIRQMNLKNYLASFAQRPAILLIGEASGPNGCRFSGIPFTSEYQLISNTLPFKGRQSSNRNRPYREASATSFWSAMKGFESEAFVWNCLPLHPHDKDRPMSIRTPTKAEIRQYSAIIRNLIDILKPGKVVSTVKTPPKHCTNWESPPSTSIILPMVAFVHLKPACIES
ncbi:MAG: hypothetical protein CSYNP_00645 [Syntrophus sp. SKADARSKE-3]|nr:hypothetical protein [Syntrophus sp. SKADARSKE-3]